MSRLTRLKVSLVRKVRGPAPQTREQLELARLAATGQFVLGDHSYHDGCVVPAYSGDAVVRVGKYCSIARGATFLASGFHRTEWVTTSPIRWKMGLPGALEDGATWGSDINVGNDVWIGWQAFIRGGVTIGDGAIVGSRAVVTHDVEPYSIVVGAPAQEVRKRFRPEQIDALLAIRWWDWPDDKVVANVHLLCSERIDDFIAAHG